MTNSELSPVQAQEGVGDVTNDSLAPYALRMYELLESLVEPELSPYKTRESALDVALRCMELGGYGDAVEPLQIYRGKVYQLLAKIKKEKR